MRERDVRNEIRDRLTDTGAFSLATLAGLPEATGFGASDLTAAAIEPQSTQQVTGWDAQPFGGLEMMAQVLITILARHEDPTLRDELAEQLLNTAADAINGQSLAGMTVPGKTRITGWRWLPATPPERRIAGTLTFSYITTWDGLDTTP
jgi:hypothetical protein